MASEQAITVRHMSFRAEGTDGRTLHGLAVPFSQPTRIDNWMEGTFDEQFKRGAFKRSLGLRTPKLQFDHGTHPLIGSLPIGEFQSLKETDRGLEVVARIFEAGLFEPLREAIASEAIDGMSIRFRALRMDVVDGDARDEGVELRTITEADLLELGPVIFPAYSGTSVDLRSFDLDDKDARHRLAEALLAGVALGGPGAARSDGPGTASEADAPATAPGQADGHPGEIAPRRLTLASRARVHEMEL